MNKISTSRLIDRMDLKEFQELGYLQEVNRRFFHPLGLALELMVYEDGGRELGGVWDYREDEEGMAFGMEPDAKKADFIDKEYLKRKETREALFGSIIQPLEKPSQSLLDQLSKNDS